MKQQVNLLMQDKKKFALIAGLGCVMLLLWGRLILKQVPRTAVADPAPTSVASASSSPSTDALRRKVIAVNKPIVEVKLPTVSKRDLFAVDLTSYPTDEVAPTERTSDKPKETVVVDEVEQQLQAMVGRIQLQSTVLGARPCAVINGQIVQVGQSYEGLVLKEVQNRLVILEFNGRLVRLRMN
jgi:hypothetical protein